MPLTPSPKVAPTTSPRLVLHRISKFYDRFLALDRVEVAIEPGEFVVVLGRNGAGKTTLLRLLALLLQPSEGELLFDGQPLPALDVAFRHRIGFVGHETFLYDELTLAENLRFYARLYGLANGAERVETVLAEMGLSERHAQLVRNLSRGLKQRLTLARAELHQPDLLLLDEPATGLDAATRARMHAWLAACHQRGRTVITSSHDLRESLRSATRLLLLDQGRLALDGPNTPEQRAAIESHLAEVAA